jgi:hypothetical protein
MDWAGSEGECIVSETLLYCIIAPFVFFCAVWLTWALCIVAAQADRINEELMSKKQ